MATPLITKPVTYQGFILSPAGTGFDLVDPSTGKWAHFPTQRYAKWTATFLRNLNARFGPLAPIPQPQEK